MEAAWKVLGSNWNGLWNHLVWFWVPIYTAVILCLCSSSSFDAPPPLQSLRLVYLGSQKRKLGYRSVSFFLKPTLNSDSCFQPCFSSFTKRVRLVSDRFGILLASGGPPSVFLFWTIRSSIFEAILWNDFCAHYVIPSFVESFWCFWNPFGDEVLLYPSIITIGAKPFETLMLVVLPPVDRSPSLMPFLRSAPFAPVQTTDEDTITGKQLNMIEQKRASITTHTTAGATLRRSHRHSPWWRSCSARHRPSRTPILG